MQSNVMSDPRIEQALSFTFLGCKLTHLVEENIDWKITDLIICVGAVWRVIKGKSKLNHN
jgi:hypothetical protein